MLGVDNQRFKPYLAHFRSGVPQISINSLPCSRLDGVSRHI